MITKQRIIKLRDDALLVSSNVNIGYLTGFLGFSQNEREAYLVVTQKKQYLLTDGRYFEEAKKMVKDFEIVRISSFNPAVKQLKKIIQKEKIKRLGFEKNNLTVGELEKIKQLIKSVVLVPTENIIEDLRTIKKPAEIEKIKKACALGDRTFHYILKKIKPGITEKQLAFEFELFIKKNGADISFPPIVAFGKNSAIPHHQTGKDILSPSTRSARSGREGQIVLLDFGVKVDGYCSDMTRVVFLGKASLKQKKIYQTVLDAQKLAVKHLGKLTSDGGRLSLRSHDSSEVDLKANDVDHVARSHIINAGFPTMPHGLGHGIGLEVHELPRLSPKSKDILRPGMVFSLEPGIYLPASPSQGGPGEFGVRIEDLVVLENSGPRILTNSTKEIIEL